MRNSTYALCRTGRQIRLTRRALSLAAALFCSKLIVGGFIVAHNGRASEPPINVRRSRFDSGQARGFIALSQAGAIDSHVLSCTD
jgi:hypothetical protein